MEFRLFSTNSLIPARRLAPLYAVETIAQVGANLVAIGIFFYMRLHFGWSIRANLILATSQGALYVIGALSAHTLTHHFGRRPVLLLLHIAMAAIMFTGALHPTLRSILPCLLTYSYFNGAQWPILESLVSAGANPTQLSHRISLYNIIWSAFSTLTMVVTGSMLAGRSTIFLVSLIGHLIAVIILLFPGHDPQTPPAQGIPDPALLPMRKLAMLLSRICLPACFAVSYALGAMMPTLSVIKALPPIFATPAASAWLLARFIAFLYLAKTTWWHARPRAMLLAAAVLLAAFLGATLIPNLPCMIVCQLALGLAIGMIYSASLYFGMVLSDGSTEHGGYHEALIGLGSVLGPGAGALVQFLAPQNPTASIQAVALILGLSVAAASVMSLRQRAARP